MNTQVQTHTELTAAEARVILADMKTEFPAAILPSPELLASVENAGLMWNFETGEVEALEPPTVRIPIVGSIGEGGRVNWNS